MFRRIATLVLLLVLLAPPAAAEPPVYQVQGVALGGSDPVAYFLVGEPRQGSPAFSADYDGAAWHFLSAEHRDLFVADPARYAPQYGGWCAFAAAKNAKAPTDPAAWRIVGDKLYLNYSIEVQRRWLTDPAGFIAAADANWPALRDR